MSLQIGTKMQFTGQLEYQVPEALKNYKRWHLDVAQAKDVEDCHRLNFQLGYKSELAGFRERFEFLRQHSDTSIVVVRSLDQKVVAWIYLSLTRSLVADDYAQIMGLIVDDSLRGHGIGAQL